CDPGLRFSISAFPFDKCGDVRIAYINMGPFQPKLQKYPSTKYDKAFCFPCYIFHDKPSKNEAFIIDGVQNWKYVGCEKNMSFCSHEGGHGSSHNDVMLKWSNLKDPSKHIDKRMNAQSSQQILENRLQLKTSISLATMNEEINKVVLENTPKNAQYIEPKIQKELLNIIANKVRHKIREEVGDAKFCIIVDEALDESHKEQMAIILRYALTLKDEICNVLAQYNLLVENLRGQGYDGASNMTGEWNGLQYLFLNDCPHSYYTHCFAHRLQLILVAVSKEVHELEIGTGANQVRTLQRARDTRWSSHFTSVSRFIEMFGATLESRYAWVKGGYREMKSFEFVFILLLLNKVLRISDNLCRTLQTKSLDILNALNYVSSTKRLLQEFRDISFCEKYDITILDMSDCYMEGIERSCQQKDYVTVEHHYHFDVFNAVIDFQLMELNSRFSEQTVELLTLSSALDLVDGLIRLVLTLPISTATTERAFSAVKLIKTSLRSKMENEFFFSNCMVIYVEREITNIVD
ncbi:hypothetical protein CICLE_v10010270mg, partial [Citrus x clementina]